MKIASTIQTLAVLRLFLTKSSGPVGITTAQILLHIYEQNKTETPAFLGNVCRTLGLHDASVSGVVNKLKDIGLVKTKNGPDRTILFEVTAKASKLLDKLFTEEDGVDESLLKPVDAKIALVAPKKAAPKKRAPRGPLGDNDNGEDAVKKAAPKKETNPATEKIAKKLFKGDTSEEAAPSKSSTPSTKGKKLSFDD